jgi:hypothetical protein
LSQKFDSKLILNIKNSPLLGGFLGVVYLGAAAMAALSALAWPWLLALWVALAASLVRTVRRHALRRAPDAVREIELDSHDGLYVRSNGDETPRRAHLLGRFLHPWLTVLVLRAEGKRRGFPVVIAADAVEGAAFTRLRARLALRNAGD